MAFSEAKNLIIFAKIFVNFLRLQKNENSKFSKHFEKMTLKLYFENCEKRVPTRIPTWTFEFKFGMQSLNTNIQHTVDTQCYLDNSAAWKLLVKLTQQLRKRFKHQQRVGFTKLHLIVFLGKKIRKF